MKLEEARVLIAKDALALIDATAMIPGHGYLGVLRVPLTDLGSIEDIRFGESGAEEESINWDERPLGQVRDVIEELPVCAVCALGGLFVAAVRRFNDITVSEMIGLDAGDRFKQFAAYLSQFWSEKELRAIEGVYEGWSQGSSYFFEEHPNDLDRLKTILNNIIANKGRFIP